CLYWATMSVDPAAPSMGIQRDGFVTSEMKRNDAPALWALPARADGGRAGVDRVDTSCVEVPDPREIPRVLSQPGEEACGHGWAGDGSGGGEKGRWRCGVGRRRHVAEGFVGPFFLEHDTATTSKRSGGGAGARSRAVQCVPRLNCQTRGWSVD